MANFRADHYLIAEFEQVSDTKEIGEKVLAALKELPEMKDLAIVSKRMEGKSWSEIVGRIDVPAGSKAFWAMIKKGVTEREPYHLFIRFDMNGEGKTIDDARSNVRTWIDGKVVPKIEATTNVKTIKVLQANEIFMPKI
jgi:hypothetical protein